MRHLKQRKRFTGQQTAMAAAWLACSVPALAGSAPESVFVEGDGGYAYGYANGFSAAGDLLAVAADLVDYLYLYRRAEGEAAPSWVFDQMVKLEGLSSEVVLTDAWLAYLADGKLVIHDKAEFLAGKRQVLREFTLPESPVAKLSAQGNQLLIRYPLESAEERSLSYSGRIFQLTEQGWLEQALPAAKGYALWANRLVRLSEQGQLSYWQAAEAGGWLDFAQSIEIDKPSGLFADEQLLVITGEREAEVRAATTTNRVRVALPTQMLADGGVAARVGDGKIVFGRSAFTDTGDLYFGGGLIRTYQAIIDGEQLGIEQRFDLEAQNGDLQLLGGQLLYSDVRQNREPIGVPGVAYGAIGGSLRVHTPSALGWQLSQQLDSQPGAIGAHFGHCLAAAAESVFICENQDIEVYDSTGNAAHVFAVREGQSERLQSLASQVENPADNYEEWRLGHRAAVSEQMAVVSDYTDYEDYQFRFRVFVPSEQGWQEQPSLMLSLGQYVSEIPPFDASGAFLAYIEPWTQRLVVQEKQGDQWLERFSLEGVEAGALRFVGDTLLLMSEGQLRTIDYQQGAFVDQGTELSPSFTAEGELALQGSTLFVSQAAGDSITVFNRPAVGQAWQRQAQLYAPSAQAPFAAAMAVTESHLAVSGRNAEGQSVVFVLKNAPGFAIEQTLLAPNSEPEGFGNALAFVGQDLYVAAPQANTPFGEQAGKVYRYADVLGATAGRGDSEQSEANKQSAVQPSGETDSLIETGAGGAVLGLGLMSLWWRRRRVQPNR